MHHSQGYLSYQISLIYSKQQYAYNTHNTTHMQLYMGNISANKSLI